MAPAQLLSSHRCCQPHRADPPIINGRSTCQSPTADPSINYVESINQPHRSRTNHTSPTAHGCCAVTVNQPPNPPNRPTHAHPTQWHPLFVACLFVFFLLLFVWSRAPPCPLPSFYLLINHSIDPPVNHAPNHQSLVLPTCHPPTSACLTDRCLLNLRHRRPLNCCQPPAHPITVNHPPTNCCSTQPLQLPVNRAPTAAHPITNPSDPPIHQSIIIITDQSSHPPTNPPHQNQPQSPQSTTNHYSTTNPLTTQTYSTQPTQLHGTTQPPNHHTQPLKTQLNTKPTTNQPLSLLTTKLLNSTTPIIKPLKTTNHSSN